MLQKLLGLTALAPLLYFPFRCSDCIASNSTSIATRLQSLVTTGITSAAVKGVTVKADGRDIILTGHVPSEETKTKASHAASLVTGVRTVDNQLVVQDDVKIVNTQLTELLLKKKIEFETGKNILLPVSIPVLEQVLRVLNTAPQLTLKIEGHTDNQGNAENNRTLSKQRAQAVVNWLSERGIPRDRMTSAGFGPDQTLAPNTTPEGRAKNRRVEIAANN